VHRLCTHILRRQRKADRVIVENNEVHVVLSAPMLNAFAGMAWREGRSTYVSGWHLSSSATLGEMQLTLRQPCSCTCVELGRSSRISGQQPFLIRTAYTRNTVAGVVDSVFSRTHASGDGSTVARVCVQLGRARA